MEVPAEETQAGSGRGPNSGSQPGCILEPPEKLNICCLGPTPGHTDSAGLECRLWSAGRHWDQTFPRRLACAAKSQNARAGGPPRSRSVGRK